MNFQRMGSVVVVISLGHYFSADQVNRKIDKLANEIAASLISHIEMTDNLPIEQKQYFDEISQDIGKKVAGIKELGANFERAEIEHLFRTSACLMGTVGTLIWGFGDLLPI